MFFAITIFVLAYIAIASEKFPRHWVALLGGALLILFGVISPSEALAYISWETLGLVAGMFTLVAILVQAGFFTWLAMTSLRKVNYHPASLFVILIVLAAVLAAFMDSITVMLFLSALTLHATLPSAKARPRAAHNRGSLRSQHRRRGYAGRGPAKRYFRHNTGIQFY